MSAAIERRISGAQLRLRMRHPFFATLALFAPMRITELVETAATDGETLFFNPAFLASLSDPALDGLLTHEILHAALLHPTRRGAREPRLWNIACDIVVNAMARAENLELPEGAVEYPPWGELSAEEIYHRLHKGTPRQLKSLTLFDLLEPGAGVDGERRPNAGGESTDSPLAAGRRAAIEAHWKAALNQARVVAARQAAKTQGRDPLEGSLEWQAVTDPQLDWRSVLWRYLVRTPTDYAGFDRRFVGQGVYLDALEGEQVDVAVCIDTSGSIGADELGLFHAELQGVLSAYPHIRCQLFFCDTELDGPHELARGVDPPRPTGGGGTDFCPFFRWLDRHPPEHERSQRLAVYLTDGYGAFPERAPEDETLWIVIGDGLATKQFPFGEVARLLG